MTGLLDGLMRRDKAAIPGLVDALRDIHQGRPTALPLAAPPSLAKLLVDSVRNSRENLSRLLETAAPRPAEHRYAELRQHVERLERVGAERAETVRSAFESGAAVPAKSTQYQETLYLQCVRGGRAAGRFRCLNRRAQRTAITTTLRPFTIDARPVAMAPSLTIRPGGFVLEAGAAAIVAVELDFASCPDLVASPLQTSIDLLMDDAVALKIWIEVEVYDAQP